tara:strand:+ start:45 stop:623 length:579 start_codon:yes stop_codon:yes gene_type:complete
MKNFNIYENPEGIPEAVKKGWSWPGFCFTWIWCFVKGLGALGGSILAFTFFGVFINIFTYSQIDYNYNPWTGQYYGTGFAYKAYPIMEFIFGFIPFIISIWIGFKGNKKREQNLISKGYKLKTTVYASSAKNAIIITMNRKIVDSEVSSNIKDEKSFSASNLEQIEKLHNLKEKGIITSEEFNQKKKELLNL